MHASLKKVLLIVVLLLVVVALFLFIKKEDGEKTQRETETGLSVESEIHARDEEARNTVTDMVTQELDYRDGEYMADSSYTVPNGTVHIVRVVADIKADKVHEIQVYFNGQKEGKTSTVSQEAFMQAMPALVEEQEVDAISLSRVGGASLTTTAFNQAFAKIKTKAQE